MTVLLLILKYTIKHDGIAIGNRYPSFDFLHINDNILTVSFNKEQSGAL